MKNNNATDVLRDKILLLENQQAQELILLKEQVHETYESFKPLNLIKSTLQEASSSIEIKDNILNNVIGLSTGYVSKLILMGTAHNPITRVIGSILQFTIGNAVANHSETIKSLGETLIMRFFKKRNEKKQEKIENEKLINN